MKLVGTKLVVNLHSSPAKVTKMQRIWPLDSFPGGSSISQEFFYNLTQPYYNLLRCYLKMQVYTIVRY